MKIFLIVIGVLIVAVVIRRRSQKYHVKLSGSKLSQLARLVRSIF